MAKQRSVIGTLKRLFKPQKDAGPGGSLETHSCGNADRAACAEETSLPDIDILSSCNSPPCRESLDIVRGPLPAHFKGSLHRKLFAFKSGPLNPGTRSTASQVILHHSNSDACDAASVKTCSSCRTSVEEQGWVVPRGPSTTRQDPSIQRAASSRMACGSAPQRGAQWCAPRPKPINTISSSLGSITEASRGPVPPTTPSSAERQAKPRSDAALPSLTLPSPIATPAAALTESRQLSEVRLPSVLPASPANGGKLSGSGAPAAGTVAERLATAGSEPLPSRLSGEYGAPRPPTPPTEGSLLAMCPGIPDAMRRQRWSLQDYTVGRRIYKGSTSAVYKATCRHSGLPVALKVYFLSRVPANVVHMILREIKIHTDLVHDNIIMLYGAFQEERRLVLVQEYAARGDLHEVFRCLERGISEGELAELVLAPFLDALCCLHGKGVCHRDIKPENILLTQDWRCVIADFGVSVDLAEERAVTRAGTLEYMAPEVERCPLKMFPEENKDKAGLAYTTAVDIWATGVLAYELLVGFPPFRVDGAAPNAAASARGPLRFPPHASAAARDFIRNALADRPEDRPTAMELRRHPWITSALAAAAANGSGSGRRS